MHESLFSASGRLSGKLLCIGKEDVIASKVQLELAVESCRRPWPMRWWSRR